MTRVTNYMQFQALNADLMRAQRDMMTAQRQASSQKIAQDLQGYGLDAGRVVNARGALERANAQADANMRLEGRMDVQDLALSQVADAADDIRAAISDALATDSSIDLMGRLDSAFRKAVDALNMSHQGQQLFAGATADKPPVVAGLDTLADLAALPSVADAFDHADYSQTARIDENTVIEIAPRASQVATDLFALFRTLQNAHAGAPGPFNGGKLTGAQKGFLEGVMATVRQVGDGVTAYQAQNGGDAARVKAAREYSDLRRDTLEKVAGDIENVDMAEVAAKLVSAQNQYQASAQMIGQMRRMTLLDFLN
jgi:flagellar hook-associated protein 3 FlgL